MSTETLMAPAQTSTRITNCQCCGSEDLRIFYRTAAVPVNSCILFDDPAAAKQYPTGKITLAFCNGCGFIGNIDFDPALARYTSAYEEQQSFSPRFNTFALELAQSLIDRFELRNKTVLEIGCGKGDFLNLLCQLGPNRGIGIDPTYIPGRNNDEQARVIFIVDFYAEHHKKYRADLICCRHTLEHISDTAAFMKIVRDSVRDRMDTVISFELPDVVRVLDETAFWDIYYEHCSYFSLGSLARLFRTTGFEVIHLAKAYDDQYLLLDARPANGQQAETLSNEESVEQLSALVTQFQERWDSQVSHWKKTIGEIRASGKRLAIWGSGSKCVAFLSTLGIADQVEAIVDINPYRQGKYLPGSGKRIMVPAYLKEYRPDVVIAMNPIYREEIRRDLDAMGLHPELSAV